MFASPDELVEAEAEGRKGVSERLAVDSDIYAELANKKYNSATDWINQINDFRLREAMQKLSCYQRNLIFLRFCKEKKLSETVDAYLSEVNLTGNYETGFHEFEQQILNFSQEENEEDTR